MSLSADIRSRSGGGAAVLELARAAPIAVGGHRLVFEHPDDGDLIIKVAREDVLRRKSRLKRWFHARSAFYHRNAPVLNEIAEYLSLRARHATHPPFVPQIVGFAETDIGLGLVVRKMRGRDGGLAPDLGRVIRREGLTAAIREHIRVFCEALLSSRAVVSDLRTANVLLAYDEENGERLVLIDGLGEKILIPVNRLSRTVNRLTCKRHIRRLMAGVERCAAATGRD